MVDFDEAGFEAADTVELELLELKEELSLPLIILLLCSLTHGKCFFVFLFGFVLVVKLLVSRFKCLKRRSFARERKD